MGLLGREHGQMMPLKGPSQQERSINIPLFFFVLQAMLVVLLALVAGLEHVGQIMSSLFFKTLFLKSMWYQCTNECGDSVNQP